MTDDTYNGWPNRATWLMHLHLSNDQGLYNETTDVASNAFHEPLLWHPSDKTDEARVRLNIAGEALAEWVRDWIADGVVEDGGCAALLAGDLVLEGLSGVEWREVAEAFLEDELVDWTDTEFELKVTWAVLAEDGSVVDRFFTREAAVDSLPAYGPGHTVERVPEPELDTESSASRQHYIDTGRYLPRDDSDDDQDAAVLRDSTGWLMDCPRCGRVEGFPDSEAGRRAAAIACCAHPCSAVDDER